MREASRELLASRQDVWGFLAEPNHLTDWWPGMVGVEPDRRGFAEGARWQVSVIEEPFVLGLGNVNLSTLGRSSGPRVSQTLLVTEVAPYESWSWRLVRRDRAPRFVRTLDVSIRLRAIAPDRTLVTIGVSGTGFGSAIFGSRDGRTARIAAGRLYDLVQTAATL
jgi:hypothetical protein